MLTVLVFWWWSSQESYKMHCSLKWPICDTNRRIKLISILQKSWTHCWNEIRITQNTQQVLIFRSSHYWLIRRKMFIKKR